MFYEQESANVVTVTVFSFQMSFSMYVFVTICAQLWTSPVKWRILYYNGHFLNGLFLLFMFNF